MDGLDLVTSLGTFLLSAAGAGFGAYIVSRWKVSGQIAQITQQLKEVVQQETAKAHGIETGKIEAINEKIEQVVNQQVLLTSATETIKSNVDIGNWINKENRALRREKIELLYSKMGKHYQARIAYLSLSDDINDMNNKKFNYHSLTDEVFMIIELYFNYHHKLDELIYNLRVNNVKTIDLVSIYINQVQFPPEEENMKLANEYLELSMELKKHFRQIMKSELIGEQDQALKDYN